MPRTLARAERASLGCVYGLLTAAGPFAVVYAPPSMIETVGDTAAAVWGVYVLIGAAGCLLGVLTGHWFYEFVFLNLLGSAIAFYGAVVLSTVDGVPGRTAGGLILLSFSILLFVIWLQRAREARIDVRTARDARRQE